MVRCYWFEGESWLTKSKRLTQTTQTLWPASEVIDDAGGPERILNQDEIDSLLGFREGGRDGGEKTGTEAILDVRVSYERLPMLEVVFDRLVRMMSTSLRNFTSDNVEAVLIISLIRFGDYLNVIPARDVVGTQWKSGTILI